MQTFDEYLSGVAQRGSFNIVFESGMYSLLNDVERIVKLLRDAGVKFELIDGVAVNAHLLTAEERSRTFVTRDIDLLVERGELPKIIEAGEVGGYEAKKIVGGYMLIRPDQRPADAVHMVFAGERSKSTQPVVHPEVRAEEMDLFELRVPVAPLEDLVRMKLSSLRVKDLVHLQILDEAKLITPELQAKLLPVLSERLQGARSQFERDQPDVDN
jgi:hypothetical protein